MNPIEWGLQAITYVSQSVAPLLAANNQNKIVNVNEAKISHKIDPAKITSEINETIAQLNRGTALAQMEAQIKRDYLQIASQAALQKSSQGFDWAKHKDNQAFQERLTALQLAENRAIVEFIQSVNWAINQQNIDFQMWKVEKDRELTMELREIDAKLTWELRAYDLEAQLKLLEERQQSDKELVNSPIWLTIRQLLSDSQETPLRILLSPVTEFPGNFPKIKTDVESKLSELANFYLSKDRPVKFIGGALSDSRHYSESVAQSLFAPLKSVPILILDADVAGDYFYLRHAYWGINWSTYRSGALISRLPWKEVQIAFAKIPVLNWFAQREAKKLKGENPETIDLIYGQEKVKIFQNHLEIITRETIAQQEGISIDHLDRPYNITSEEIKKSGEYLVILHCLWAGLFIDEYFLLHAPTQLPLSPLLPQLLPSLLQGFSEEDLQTTVQSVIFYYNNLFQILESKGEASLIPDLRLELAQSLLSFPKQFGAREQVKESSKSWLKLRGVIPQESSQNGDNQELEYLINSVRLLLTTADFDYVNNLNACLAVLGEEANLNIIDSCYNRGIKHYHEGEYQSAIIDFDQVIKLNSNWVEIYKYRGLSYAKLEQYQQAINDYERLLELNYNHAETYNNLGSAYYKLANYQKAIDFYKEAIEFGCIEATKNLEFAEYCWTQYNCKEEVERRQKEENERQEQKLKAQQGQIFEFDIATLNQEGNVTKIRSQARRQIENTVNGINLEMVFIPGGTFQMGSLENDAEKPPHQVNVGDFYMSRYPITQAQWKAVVALKQVNRSLPADPAYFKGDNLPIENISWHDAVEFCARLSRATNRNYRLPSEAEWEYACRAQTITPFHFGETISSEIANYNGNYNYALGRKGINRLQTTAVDTFKVANMFGLSDMHGNVWEWCADFWHDNYDHAPTDGSIWTRNGNSLMRVIRGGSWHNNPMNCRSAYRSKVVPSFKDSNVGFRVVEVISSLGIS